MNGYTTNQFLDLEYRVWDAMKSGNIEADAEVLSDDFLGVYNDGFSGKSEHVGQLINGPIISCYELTDARIIVLSENIVLLSYLANFRRLDEQGRGKSEKMYVSSIWVNTKGEWKNVFSQDTPTEHY